MTLQSLPMICRATVHIMLPILPGMRRAIAVFALLAVLGLAYWNERERPAGYVDPALEAIESGEIIDVAGVVERLLPDDQQGSRHQRFIVRVAPDRTLLVSHNIDLAPRIDDLEIGDRVEIRGEYEWNARGGLLHWTHHDPIGRHEPGWIRHGGKEYR